MLRSPLWPASPPPALSLQDARLEVELVVDDDDLLRFARCGSAARAPTPPDPTRSCT